MPAGGQNWEFGSEQGGGAGVEKFNVLDAAGEQGVGGMASLGANAVRGNPGMGGAGGET